MDDVNNRRADEQSASANRPGYLSHVFLVFESFLDHRSGQVLAIRA